MKNKKYTVINGDVKEITFVEKRDRADLWWFESGKRLAGEFNAVIKENIYTYKQGNLNIEIVLEDELVFNEISTANLYKKILEQEKKLQYIKEEKALDYLGDYAGCPIYVKKPWYKFW